MKRRLALILATILVSSIVFTACGSSEAKKEEENIPTEVGKWHGEFSVNDINENSMASEDRAILAALAGDVVFEIDLEFCKDGTFSYILNTDKLEQEFSKTISTLSSLFFDIDVSLFTDRIVKVAVKDVMKTSKSEYLGEYEKVENGSITAIDGEKLFFKVIANQVIQVDEKGNKILSFKKMETASK